MPQAKACWEKRERKSVNGILQFDLIFGPTIWSPACSGQIVGESEHGQGCWSISSAARKSLETEYNEVLFFFYSHHFPAPSIICIWDWFRRNVRANICESWLFMKLLMLWQCWLRLPSVASSLYQSGCGYTSKSIFVTVAYFGQGIFCQHKPPVQSWGYL